MGVKYREELSLHLSGLTLRTLEETPERQLKTVRAIGNNRVIRRWMQSRGYSSAAHVEGVRLIAKIMGMGAPDGEEPATDPFVSQAAEDVDPHDEVLVEVTDASLHREFAEQNNFLLAGITPAGGMEAVINISLYLERRDVLMQGTGRDATHDKDVAAVKLLEERGITSELCAYFA